MSLDADHIVDRRRMRRKLTFWRVVAVAARRHCRHRRGAGDPLAERACLRPAGAYHRAHQDPGPDPQQPGARRGAGAAGKSSARAVIVHIDSPGGTTAGLRAAL